MADAPLFEIRDLCVSTNETSVRPAVEILRGVSLTVGVDELHSVIAPTGSDGATLAAALLGSPSYQVTSGSIRFRGDDITDWSTDVRAKAGLFLAFPNPHEIAGVSVFNLIRQAVSARKGTEMSGSELRVRLMEWMERLAIPPSFMERHVDDGFSPTEKAQNEVLQMAVLSPEMAVLDQTDPDRDNDTFEIMSAGVQAIRDRQSRLGMLSITRASNNQLVPDKVHLLEDGRIVTSGGPEPAMKFESDGHESEK